jgi:hypothetical protein
MGCLVRRKMRGTGLLGVIGRGVGNFIARFCVEFSLVVRRVSSFLISKLHSGRRLF